MEQPLNASEVERHADRIVKLAQRLSDQTVDRGTHGNSLLLDSLEHAVSDLRSAVLA